VHFPYTMYFLSKPDMIMESPFDPEEFLGSSSAMASKDQPKFNDIKLYSKIFKFSIPMVGKMLYCQTLSSLTNCIYFAGREKTLVRLITFWWQSYGLAPDVNVCCSARDGLLVLNKHEMIWSSADIGTGLAITPLHCYNPKLNSGGSGGAWERNTLGFEIGQQRSIFYRNMSWYYLGTYECVDASTIDLSKLRQLDKTVGPSQLPLGYNTYLICHHRWRKRFTMIRCFFLTLFRHFCATWSQPCTQLMSSKLPARLYDA
jgi:hypothetical protein